MSNIKDIIYKVVKKLMPEMWFESLWYFYVAHNTKYDEDRYKRAYFRKGIRTKGRYCILRYTAPDFGIGAVARVCLLACEWAEHQGMVPIIDFEYEYCFKHDMIGKENMWEYVFEQKESVKELYQKKPVFVGHINEHYFLPSMSERLLGSKEENLIKFKTEGWREYYQQLNVYSNKWWILRPEIKKRFEDKYAELFKPEMKILGVALREHFSKEREKIEGSALIEHPHEPKLEDMIKLIKEYKEKWRCTHIFIATAREDSITVLKKEFENTLIYIERERLNFEEEEYVFNAYEIAVRSPDEYYIRASEDNPVSKLFSKELAVGYVEEIYGISKCDCLLSSKNGGSLVACIWNGGKYEKLKILEDDNKSRIY